jgi:hypothetical protein
MPISTKVTAKFTIIKDKGKQVVVMVVLVVVVAAVLGLVVVVAAMRCHNIFSAKY